MKNNLITRMFVILIINVFAVAASVYSIIYVTTSDALTEDIQRRADGVKSLIMDNLSAEDFVDIGENSEAGIKASQNMQEILALFRDVGNLERLYITKVNEADEIITTLRTLDSDDADYVPTGVLEADLRKSLDEGVAVFGNRIYQSSEGKGVYTIFWPVFNSDNEILGVVCMEFDVDIIYRSHQTAAIYSIVLSAALIVLFSIIAYLSMSRISEPFYKKLAYTDILTGFENRMAFEHRLRECGDIVDRNGRVTLVICDVNNLKTVNDTQGHKAGDMYLKITADILHQNIEKLGASLYRIGGDEFASLITYKSEKEELSLLEALRNEKRMTLKNQPFSCAFGAATFTKGVDKNLRDVFKRADEAMYTEKKRQKGLLR
ncbi:MAG: diguanylate cyclase [Oscillospiraceae bacterium]|nr:diguanylate cyclase [Oscillospiraceae bacterium]